MSFAFEPKAGPIFVEGEITGPTRSTAVRLILDTGATTSVINSRVLIGLGFDPAGGPDNLLSGRRSRKRRPREPRPEPIRPAPPATSCRFATRTTSCPGY